MKFFWKIVVCEDEVRRISDAYKRACGIGSGMKEAVFIRDVMGDSVPEKLSQVTTWKYQFLFL